VKKDHLGTFVYIVECKKYAQNRHVGVKLVRQLCGVVHAEHATAGILVTTSFFTREAKRFQETIPNQISLKDYSGIRAWLDAIAYDSTKNGGPHRGKSSGLFKITWL
jgi:restriction system protein